jgi:dTDP-4-amino-4,6-dideoxygalactose transaminase
MNTDVVLPSERDASGRSFGPEERTLLLEVLESGVLFGPNGTKVQAFEAEIAALLGTRFARAVSSGSAAVHTALAALDISPGEEVITTPITDMGGISPILCQGAIPVFADVDPETLNITAETVAQKISDRTRAVIVTHLFGNPCDMDPIMKLATERDIALLEDAAQAYLAEYRGRYVGTFGQIAAFSLQQTKQITCGEGGFVATESDGLARRARVWADKGWNYESEAPDHEFLGLNYRMSELQGAVALAQVRKLTAMVDHRVRVAEILRQRLDGVAGVRPVPVSDHAVATYWRFPLLVDSEIVPGGPAALASELKSLGVWSTPNYIRYPAFMCRQFRERVTFGQTDHPYSLHGDYPLESLDDFPGCKTGLANVLVLPWTERHNETHAAFIAERITEAADRLVRDSSRPSGRSG